MKVHIWKMTRWWTLFPAMYLNLPSKVHFWSKFFYLHNAAISYINYWDQVTSWKTFWKFWNGPLCRNKSLPLLLLNFAALWQSSNTVACAKKLSQILASNIGNGGRETEIRIYVNICRYKGMKSLKLQWIASTSF